MDRGDPLPPKQTSPAQQAGHEARGAEARGRSRESEEMSTKKANAADRLAARAPRSLRALFARSRGFGDE